MSASVSGSAVKAEPNVTPLVDVMLVLLIIFMVIIPTLTSGLNAEPPQGINLKQHPEEEGDQLLGISRDGQYYLNRNPIRNETLGDQLKQIYDARETDKILYIRADRQLEYSKVLDASDIASKSGVRVVGYISEQTPGTEEQSVEAKKGGD
ncbi:biopolymer transporter ExbD [Roseisolibacter sp. H3M3-2]|uniref:ExbD/TolR family protein n=1 Tax=Roseisolibacter sp. H3M3-2 TaxID=3031323 RepID=UPI0023DB4046|nr:biopolymer transporter ExbD [Roseisolibacter sp. H3M3-2]MDF1501955.1 biopolymer transporter ExbD [Roseisolibacter sp. H3M3-2]